MGKKEDRDRRPQKCAMCNGDGGKWVEPNGKAHERGVREWQRCSGCDGSGRV